MKNIIHIFYIVLLIYYCKGEKSLNKIYRFANVLKSSNNYDLNNLNDNQSGSMIIDMLFNIYSSNKDYNKAWVILLNFSINNSSYVKNENINNKNYSNFLTLLNEMNYNSILDYININDFEEPNFNLNEIFLNKEYNESNKLKNFYNFPLIKFTFSENGILNIYKPNTISNFDFIILIQNINEIIYLNKNKFLSFNSQTQNQENEFEYDENIEKWINKIYLIYKQHKLCPLKNEEHEFFLSTNFSSNSTKGDINNNFSFKKYFETLTKKKHFNLVLFKRKLLFYKIIGIIKFDIIDDKKARIKFDIIGYSYNQKYLIFSKNYISNTTKIINFINNKIGEFGEQLDNLFNSLINKYPQYEITNKIKTIISIFGKINVKSLFNQPFETIFNLLINNNDVVFDYITFITNYIFNYSINNQKYLKILLDSLMKRIGKLFYSNNKFLNDFSKYFNKDYILNNITKTINEKFTSIYNNETINNVIKSLNKTLTISGEVVKNNAGKFMNSSQTFLKKSVNKIKNVVNDNSTKIIFNNFKNKITNSNNKIKNCAKKIKSKIIRIVFGS